MAEQPWVPTNLTLPPEGIVVEVHIPKWPGKGYDAADATYFDSTWHRVSIDPFSLRATPAPAKWRHKDIPAGHRV